MIDEHKKQIARIEQKGKPVGFIYLDQHVEWNDKDQPLDNEVKKLVETIVEYQANAFFARAAILAVDILPQYVPSLNFILLVESTFGTEPDVIN